MVGRPRQNTSRGRETARQQGEAKNMNPPLLEMRGIEKSFGVVRALDGVGLSLCGGECLALVGENGAGKSTLMKILGGVQAADRGEIRVDGRPVLIANCHHAQKLGIAIIYQEFNLVPGMTVRDNIFLGREISRFGVVNTTRENQIVSSLFDRIGVHIHPDALCRDLTIAEQQVVEIAKALSQDSRILVMDEPSATLTGREVDRLFDVIRDLKRQGIGIVYVSHRLDELFEIADRVTVLRDGRHIGTCDIDQVDKPKLIEMMVGRRMEQEFPQATRHRGSCVLEAENLTREPKVRGVSFRVHAGEILGIAGLVGAGRTETARLVFGADRPDAGRIFLDGRAVRVRSPRAAIALGIGYLSEDRKGDGLVLGMSCEENFSLPSLPKFSRSGWIRQSLVRRRFQQYVESLDIRLAARTQPAVELSGGNQQKLVLAKWLETDSRIVIFDEPTRGIDVGAKYEIYLLMNGLADAGKAVIMISSELEEVLGMSDRVLVMHEGRIKGELTDMSTASQADIMSMAMA